MINMSALTTALYNVLAADAVVSTTCTAIERGERINYDPGRCPWAGVYPGNARSQPKAFGAGPATWSSTGTIQLVIQTASFVDDGKAASDALETLAASACAAVNADLSLGVAGLRIVGAAREYKYVMFDDDGGGTVFMPQMIISFEFEMRSSGS